MSAAKLIEQIRDRVWLECDPSAIVNAGPSEAPRIVAALANQFFDDIVSSKQEQQLRVDVIDGVVAATLGLGPLQSLLSDPDISEIMVNGHRDIFVERFGKIERSDTRFDDDDHVLRVIDRILAPLGRRIDALSPIVDARLSDGSRVNAIISPLAVDGPVLTIRRFVAVAQSLDDLVRLNTLDAAAAFELERLVHMRANVIISGGTGTGKTTLLAACLAATKDTDRLIIIEDATELPLDHPHRIRLECRPSTAEGTAEVSMTQLVKNALRMRPDRIILGEVRGVEAWDLLQALNTGHRGSWSTIHANSVEDALLRLESLVLMAAAGIPHQVVREQIVRGIDAVIQIERNKSGARFVTSIARITPKRDGRSLTWQLNTIYAHAVSNNE